MDSVMYETPRFKHPFTCIISGPTGSGKSSFCIKLLQNLESVSTEARFDGGILWYYGESNAVPRVDIGRKIQFREGVTSDFTNEGNRPCLIILDDLLHEAYSEEVCKLFTKGSHHRNISVILITQNLFQQAKQCRTISLNAKYLVLLKNARDRSQFSHLARQVYPEDSVSLSRAYREATRRPHGYFVLDFAQDTPDVLRYRTNIFPGEGPLTVYIPWPNEEDQDTVPRTAGIEKRPAEAAESHRS